MNARRVHELMLEKFPGYDAAVLDWTVVADGKVPRCAALRDRLLEHYGDREVVIEVHRKLGVSLRSAEAVDFIAADIGEAQ